MLKTIDPEGKPRPPLTTEHRVPDEAAVAEVTIRHYERRAPSRVLGARAGVWRPGTDPREDA
jgi:hypothetical protein